MAKWKRYKKEMSHSYAFGAFAVFELLESRPASVLEILISPDFTNKDKLEKICRDRNIPLIEAPAQIDRLSDKDHHYVMAVYRKETEVLKPGDHILLENPRDMGNLGTIVRTALAMGFYDLALLGQCCDHHHPKVVRASMGAVFKLRIAYFKDLDAYKKSFENSIYAFRLDPTAKELLQMSFDRPFTLAFGNEGSGLSKDFEKEKGVFIAQSADVDSLNLAIAVGIAGYCAKREGRNG